MIAEIQKRFADLENRRKKILKQLEMPPHNRLNVKPGPDKWSIVEVIQHLVLVEREIVKQTVKNPVAQDPGRVPRFCEAFETVLEILERDVRIDVPSASMEPDGQITLDDLRTQWEDSRAQLGRFFQGLNKEGADTLVFSHPVAGSLNALDLLHLANVHTDYHIRQVEGIQRHLCSILSPE
jgi:hypothetical protein